MSRDIMNLAALAVMSGLFALPAQGRRIEFGRDDWDDDPFLAPPPSPEPCRSRHRGYEPPREIEYISTPKPLSKRARRRLRGKAKAVRPKDYDQAGEL